MPGAGPRTARVVRQPRAATLIGPGQAQALAARVAELDAELVVIDAQISAIQQKNLEKALAAKVIDRMAHGVPDYGHTLPFIDDVGAVAGEHIGRVGRGDLQV